ncbi:hypothetical protein H4R34_002097 [Dimargaris verticillata]|uniref:Uncharacterized protein n=1 Tax=Dimargaris verticillata TaxID=2761393 RepID=A0A9W8B2F0_9FUNG|nr:hypothetical protein H4R34_002097 [Dimargaris verticillata]
MVFQAPPSVILSLLSVVSGVLIMFIVILLRLWQPKVARTASFLLSFWIGLSDALYRGTVIVSKQYEYVEQHLSDGLVRYLFWSEYFYPVWFVMLTVMIAVDLQLTFIHHRRSQNRSFQRYYLPIATLAAFCITIPALFVPDIYWNTEFHGYTWTFGTNTRDSIFVMLGFNIWVALGVVYCAVIVVIIAYRLVQEVRSWGASVLDTTTMSPRRSQFTVELHRSVARILLYPLVPIITQSLNVVVDWIPFYSDAASTVRRVGTILVSTQGILNLVVFLLNPALHRAISNIRDRNSTTFREPVLPLSTISNDKNAVTPTLTKSLPDSNNSVHHQGPDRTTLFVAPGEQWPLGQDHHSVASVSRKPSHSSLAETVHDSTLTCPYEALTHASLPAMATMALESHSSMPTNLTLSNTLLGSRYLSKGSL